MKILHCYEDFPSPLTDENRARKFPDTRNEFIVSSVCYPIPLNLLIALYVWVRCKIKNPWT